MAMEELLIDADGHILEPPDLWEKYLEPKYRDRAIRIKRGDDGREYLEIDNKVSALTSPTLLASLGGMKKLQELGATVEDVNAKRRDLLKARSGEKHRVFDSLEGVETVESYVGGAAYGAMDAKERLALLDTEGMAKTILYPTIGRGSLGRLLPCLQSLDRGLLPRFGRTAGADRAYLARRPRRSGSRTRARRQRRLQGRLRLPIHHHAQAARPR
jgi:hypothetical protein